MPQQPSTSPTSHQIRPLTPADLEAVVVLSLLAWEPVFVSFSHILGEAIFDALYRPHRRAAQAAAVRGNCLAEGGRVLRGDHG